jgi:hypothetical protein
MKISDRLFNEVGATLEEVEKALKVYELYGLPEAEAIRNETVNEMQLRKKWKK